MPVVVLFRRVMVIRTRHTPGFEKTMRELPEVSVQCVRERWLGKTVNLVIPFRLMSSVFSNSRVVSDAGCPKVGVVNVPAVLTDVPPSFDPTTRQKYVAPGSNPLIGAERAAVSLPPTSPATTAPSMTLKSGSREYWNEATVGIEFALTRPDRVAASDETSLATPTCTTGAPPSVANDEIAPIVVPATFVASALK